jgi:VCBS repeat-containing protein
VTLPSGTWRAVWTRPVDLVELRNETFTHAGGTRTLAPVSYQEDVVLRIDRVTNNPNTAPVANADTYTVQQNLQLMVPTPGVIINDTDAQQNPLTAVLDSGPLHGTLTLLPNGGFTYVPTANYTGTDSFTYHVNDGTLNSNTITVALTVSANVAGSFVNGSFESGYTAWTRTGNQLIQSAPPDQIPEGIRYVTFNSAQTSPNGILAQTFSTTPGQTYLVSFHIGVLSYNLSEQRMQVDVTGATVQISQTFAISGSSGGTIRWLDNSLSFTAASTAATLTFRDQSPSTSSIDLLLDHVRVLAALPPVAPGILPMVPAILGTPGNLTIQMTATLAGSYFLESSEDIMTWTRIDQIEISTPGPITFPVPPFSDGTSTYSARMFYRIGRESN